MAHANQNYVFRSLREEELDDWFSHLGTVFTVGRDYFVQHWQNDPWANLKGILVCVDTQQPKFTIAATLRVFHREVYWLGEKTGVGNCTSASVTSKEIGLTIKMAVKFMQENKYIYSLLRTAATTSPFYQQLGWEVLPEQLTQVSVNHNSGADCPGQVTVNIGTEMTVRLCKYESYNHLSPNHQVEVRKIYDSSCKQYNGPVARTADVWSKWTSAYPNCTSWLIMSQSEDQVLGYFCLSTSTALPDGTPLIKVLEYGMLTGDVAPLLESQIVNMITTTQEMATFTLQFLSSWNFAPTEHEISRKELDSNSFWMIRNIFPEVESSSYEQGKKNFQFWSTDNF